MIEFLKAKIFENKQTGKKGMQIDRIHVAGQVTEAVAKALGDDVRNTLYNSKGVIRQSFGKMDLTHVFADATFHLSVNGIKGAEIHLEGVLVHRFRVAMRGDGNKKPKTLLCGFEVEHTKTASGPSSPQLQEFLRKYINAVGVCRLKYPKQEAMFTEEAAPPVVPGVYKYAYGKVTAEIRVSEHKDGYASMRKVKVAGSRLELKQKAPIVSASEAEALALAAQDVRSWADSLASSAAKGSPVREAAAQLDHWASSFASAATTVPITRHTS